MKLPHLVVAYEDHRVTTRNPGHTVTAVTALPDRGDMAGDHGKWRKRQRQRSAAIIAVLSASWASAAIIVLILRRAWAAG
jgi:hypothetical protein